MHCPCSLQFAAEFDKECFEQSQSKEEEFPQGFSASELFSFISSQSRLNLQLLHVAQKLKALGTVSFPPEYAV